MTLTISFPGTAQTTLMEVGGKGFSLIRMVAAGLPVPPSAVLTTAFFEPWFDEKQYRPVTKPAWVRLRMLWLIPKVLWWLRRFFWNFLQAILTPEHARRAYQRKVDAYEIEITENLDYGLPFEEFRRAYTAPMARMMFDVTMPALLAGLMSADFVVRKNAAEVKALTEKLKVGFTGNIVVEMGIALFHLARLLNRSDFENVSRLAVRKQGGQGFQVWRLWLAP